MEKLANLDDAFVYPMPVVLAGALVDGRPNFMAVGWVSRVNMKPPWIGIVLAKSHQHHRGHRRGASLQRRHPGHGAHRAGRLLRPRLGEAGGQVRRLRRLLRRTRQRADGRRMPRLTRMPAGQGGRGTVERSDLCRRSSGRLCDPACLTDGRPDAQKVAPFVLTMPDSTYHAPGAVAGHAWSDGKALQRGG